MSIHGIPLDILVPAGLETWNGELRLGSILRGDPCPIGTRGGFAGRDETHNPGECEQSQSAELRPQTERSCKPMCDHDTHRGQNSREEQVHAHPVERSERQIVGAHKDHQSWKEPVHLVET